MGKAFIERQPDEQMTAKQQRRTEVLVRLLQAIAGSLLGYLDLGSEDRGG